MRWPVIAILGFAGACGILEPLGVTFDNRRRMAPPPVYPIWYAAVEMCLGTRGDYGSVKWYIADAIHSKARSRRVRGHIVGDEITIDKGYTHSPTVLHESAHHITGLGDELHRSDGTVPCQDAQVD